MPVGVEFNVRDVTGIGARLQRLAETNPSDALPVIGESITAKVQETFEKAQDPYGTPWKQLSALTLAMRGASARPLQDTRRLRNSINYQVRDGKAVAVGTNVIYARVHQFGNPTHRVFGGPVSPLPARPFLPWKTPNAKPELPKAWMVEAVNALEALYEPT
ncbi:MAG: phage virion morphogenesis protein [Deinococcota bacterium]